MTQSLLFYAFVCFLVSLSLFTLITLARLRPATLVRIRRIVTTQQAYGVSTRRSEFSSYRDPFDKFN